jgi:hypothetical protein
MFGHLIVHVHDDDSKELDMRSTKKILLGLAIPMLGSLAGLGLSSSAQAGGPIVIILPPPGSTCETVLCSAGTICIDTKQGPQCIPNPNGPGDK